MCTPTLSTTTGSISITNASSFQCIVLICYPLSNSSCGYSTNNNNGFYCYKTAGGYSNLVLSTDWNISTDSSTGYPAITYLDSTNNLLMCNGLKWINSTMSLEINNNVNVSSLTNKSIIRWNGSNWVNVADLTNAETNISNLQV